MCSMMKVEEVERVLIRRGHDVDLVREYARTEYQFMQYSTSLNPIVANDVEQDYLDWVAVRELEVVL